MDSNRDRPIEEAAQAMDDQIRDMEQEREHLEGEIEASRRELRDMQATTGGGVAGDWRDTDDDAGGEDPHGAGKHDERHEPSRADDEASRGGVRRG